MHDYNGKIVAITGGASGLGEGMATRFAERGVKLSLADINPASSDEFEKK